MQLVPSVMRQLASTQQQRGAAAAPRPHRPQQQQQQQQQQRRRRVLQPPRAGGEDEVAGLADLLKRDRKTVELREDAFTDTPAAVAVAAPPSQEQQQQQQQKQKQQAPSARRRAGPKSRQQRQADIARAADDSKPSPQKQEQEQQQQPPRFKRCKEAIDAGLEAFAAKDYGAAIELWNQALELPGNGAYRLSGSPREYSCPSDAEETAVMYNLACAYAQLGSKAAALECLEAAFELGFTDFKALEADPDLAPARGPELAALVGRFTGVGALLSKLPLPGSANRGGNEGDVITFDPNKDDRPWWSPRW